MCRSGRLVPNRLAFFEKGGDALPALGGGPRRGDATGRVADHAGVDGTAGDGADELLELVVVDDGVPSQSTKAKYP